MASSDRVLDITTNRERPSIRIDQVDYPLRNSNDLTLDVYKTLERVAPRITELLLMDTLTPADGSELSQLLDQICRIALVTPSTSDLHDRLSDINRLTIYQVFTELLTPNLLQAARAETPGARRAAGTKLSRASSGSTAAPPKPGSPRRRSASSART